MAEARRRWSWQVGKLFGISIRVHATLLVMLIWIAFAAPIAGLGMRLGLAQGLLVVALFGCIVIHELAHALVARSFGCATREILLLPIGGLAQMERLPQRPPQELLVALVGPVANIAIAAMLAGVIAIAGWSFATGQPTFAGSIVVPLFWSNIALAAFNLLPAFPMDGGRVLRALLATKLDRPRATRIAGTVGKVLAVGFVMIGLTQGATMLAIIGAFVWLAATHESVTVAFSAMAARATVADAMHRDPHFVDAGTSIDDAAEQMVAEGQRELAVVEQGRVTGIVTITDLARHMTAPRPHGAIASAMHRDVPIVAPTTPLDAVLEPLDRRGIVLVGDRDAIVGMLTAEQLATFAALRQT